MNQEQIVKRTGDWDTDNDIELAGILLTISAITKRLAKLLLDSDTQKGGND